MINYESVVQLFIDQFPEYRNAYKEHVEFNEECLPHVFFGDEVNPILIKLLEEEGHKIKLKVIFDFFEKMAIEGDHYVQELLTVTILARIGDDTEILNRALIYMGEVSKSYSKEIENYWNHDFKSFNE